MKNQIKNIGIDLWQEAKKVIPGGNQLLSKRSEMFLPDQWPAYYKKAKGVEVWDLDDNHYFDMNMMSVGACVLGYANEAVNKAVKEAVDLGNMSTLNCPEEVELAKKLVELHPWADMVRFSRAGGEACAMAVRIARAASKKDKVAFCGYHGWHDWYLASNLEDGTNLNAQLLPDLKPTGISQGLKSSAFPFHYGNIKELEEIVAKHGQDLGVIIMEVQRHQAIDVEFIKSVRQIANKIKAVLIFDEVTSGFRLRAGGMHVLYGLEPDIVVLGKGMGNGYPIAAVVGKRVVMEAAQETFISSTYWTERVGFVAALEVIRQFEENHVADHLTEIGRYISKGLLKIFEKHHLDIEIEGLVSMPIMMIKEDQGAVIKTVFIQEMLKRGFLSSTAIYVSYAHTKTLVDQYLVAANEVWSVIAKAIKTKSLNQLLEGPVCHTGFKRLA